MPQRSIGLVDSQPIGIDVPQIPPITLMTISAYLWPISSPADSVIVKVCEDDGDGTEPGTEVANFTILGSALTVGGGWTTPEQPLPAVTRPFGHKFWLLFDRTGAYSFTTRYNINLGDPSGQGEAGPGHYALDVAGFQWQGVNDFGVDDGIWYTYTTSKLATRATFSDGHSWDNGKDGPGAPLPFGRGNSTSLRGASRYSFI